MRGSVAQRKRNGEKVPGVWSLIFDTGYGPSKKTGKRVRHQKWITFKTDPNLPLNEQEAAAHAALRKELVAVDRGEFVEPSKTTLVEWLRDWLAKSVQPMRRPATYKSYKNVIENHIAKAPVAFVPLQKLRASHLEHYLAHVPGAVASLNVHVAVLHRALKKAVKDRMLSSNPAVDLERRRNTGDTQAVRLHCWSEHEARQFLECAKTTASAQTAAFFYLALDSGARRAELAGLGWEHLDLEAGTLTIARQLDTAGTAPTFGPTKTRRVRTLSLAPETIEQLRVHRQAQLELKMKNRLSYVDFGLVFAKEELDMQTPDARLGQPIKTLGAARFATLVKHADVRRIRFHGLRHTTATLLLQAGELPHVVAARLGHSVMMLMQTYAHALPNMQQDAAARLGRLLHGR